MVGMVLAPLTTEHNLWLKQKQRLNQEMLAKIIILYLLYFILFCYIFSQNKARLGEC